MKPRTQNLKELNFKQDKYLKKFREERDKFLNKVQAFKMPIKMILFGLNMLHLVIYKLYA